MHVAATNDGGMHMFKAVLLAALQELNWELTKLVYNGRIFIGNEIQLFGWALECGLVWALLHLLSLDHTMMNIIIKPLQ